MKRRKARPILKWKGSRSRNAPKLYRFAPTFCHYREPFCGSASMFFTMPPYRWDSAETFHLNDLNPHLIHLYESIRDGWIIKPILTAVKKMQKMAHQAFDETFQLLLSQLRYSAITGPADPIAFIILNRLAVQHIVSFDRIDIASLARVFRSEIKHLTEKRLVDAHDMLRDPRVTITCGSYQSMFKNAAPADFWFIDPPYPMNREHYHSCPFYQTFDGSVFSVESHKQLFAELCNLQAPFVLTLGDEDNLIGDLYRNSSFDITTNYFTGSQPNQVSPGKKEMWIVGAGD